MLAVPAAIAGCRQRIMCTPPTRTGAADAAVLVAARKAGVQRVFKVGGAQAIAAMAYGTPSIPKCDKLYGPGNAWVTAAKLCVAGDAAGAAVDLPAGVTEVMVIADNGARADFVAADLLAQAEHGTEAQALLVTPSANSRREGRARGLRAVRDAVPPRHPRGLHARDASAHGRFARHGFRHRERIRARASDSPGARTAALARQGRGRGCGVPRPLVAGANRAITAAARTTRCPTYGYARAYSGLSLEDFQKRITVQELTAGGLQALGGVACTLAGLEGLDAHAAAVNIRLAALAEHAT